MAKNITIYTTNTCGYCVMVKKWLTIKGFTYNEVNIEEQPEQSAEEISTPDAALRFPGCKNDQRNLAGGAARGCEMR